MAESGLRSVYSSLLEQPEGRSHGPYIVAGRAGESPLILMLLGRETGSPSPMSTHQNLLGKRELILFIEWADLGAEWESPPVDEERVP
jgi:hypothetical protein